MKNRMGEALRMGMSARVLGDRRAGRKNLVEQSGGMSTGRAQEMQKGGNEAKPFLRRRRGGGGGKKKMQRSLLRKERSLG